MKRFLLEKSFVQNYRLIKAEIDCQRYKTSLTCEYQIRNKCLLVTNCKKERELIGLSSQV